MNVYVFMHASRYIHMHVYIYIVAHIHSWMCACTHVCMDTRRSIDNMMKMQKFIVYVGDYLTTHGLLQRMHGYVYLIIIADTIIADTIIATL